MVREVILEDTTNKNIISFDIFKHDHVAILASTSMSNPLEKRNKDHKIGLPQRIKRFG